MPWSVPQTVHHGCHFLRSRGQQPASLFSTHLHQLAPFTHELSAPPVAQLKFSLVTEVNWDVNAQGISMQAMDSSHVCLVAFKLNSDGFDHFRCDRPLSLGISMGNLAKILKCAGKNYSKSLACLCSLDW